MPTHSRTAGRHRPPPPRRHRAERRRKALRALLAVIAVPAHPALCWWFAPYAARLPSSRTHKP